MNRKELILDFIRWYKHHYIKTDCLIDASNVVDHQSTAINGYLETLETVEYLNKDPLMKTWCIEFERELDGKDVIHIDAINKPSKLEAIVHIKEEGYGFNEKYDQVIEIYEV